MQNENIAGVRWQDYKISIDELDEITNDDCLGRLLDEVEEALERKNSLLLNIAVSAKPMEEFFSSTIATTLVPVVYNDTTIWHSSVDEMSAVPNNISENSVSQVYILQSGTPKSSTSQISST